jgi:regulator of sigma E protease
MIVGLRSSDDLRGPIGIVQMSGQAAQIGVTSVIQFMAVLSISLGLINLFPIPILDGGHLLFYAFEAVRGKPLGERAQEYGFRVGLALVVGLMVIATWNDLVQLEVIEYVARLFS